MIVWQNKVILFGGMLETDIITNNVHILDLEIGWEYFPHLCGTKNDSLSNNGIVHSSILEHSVETTKTKLYPPPRRGHSAVIKDDQMIVYGGIGKDDEVLNDVWILHFESHPQVTWETIITHSQEESVPRFGHNSVVWGNRILVLGGNETEDDKPSPNSIDSPQHHVWELHLKTRILRKIDFGSKDVPFLPLFQSRSIIIDRTLFVFQNPNFLYYCNMDNFITFSAQHMCNPAHIYSGTSSHIYESVLDPGRVPVAYKKMGNQRDVNDHKLRIQYQDEVNIMKRIQHPNTVSLYYTVPSNLGLILEFCVEGSLRKFIKNQKRNKEPFSVTVQLLLDVASAVNYLHDLNPPIIHRDLKPENILLVNGQDRLTAKISDFGLSKIKRDNDDSSCEPTGTHYYMAPEIFQQKQLTKENDTFSFGVIMWEMLTLQHIKKQFRNHQAISTQIINGHRPSTSSEHISNGITEQTEESCVDLMQNCWQHNPEERPRFTEIILRLKNIMAQCENEQNKNKNIADMNHSTKCVTNHKLIIENRMVTQVNTKSDDSILVKSEERLYVFGTMGNQFDMIGLLDPAKSIQNDRWRNSRTKKEI
eukprot:gb/GECH01011045.1/.p1 GENE.gb/GECH01011045.1/~~gb/GECH01011045.1/.p1  ORF type:complete len:590 (+),score=80.22 gb/GECH01011045.1/:1-1770(+)